MATGSEDISELIAGRVRELIKLVNETDISELRIEQGDLRLFIAKRKGEEPSPAQAELEVNATAVEANGRSPIRPEAAFILAPMVGRFYRSAPGEPPLVTCGDLIAKGQRICVVESMKILNDVLSEVDGQVDEVLCDDGQAVEYGQSLFRVRRETAD